MAEGILSVDLEDWYHANYDDVDPQTGALEIRPEGKKDVLLSVPNVNFETGHRYTIIVLGKAKGAPKLEAVKVDDLLIGATPYPAAPVVPQ